MALRENGDLLREIVLQNVGDDKTSLRGLVQREAIRFEPEGEQESPGEALEGGCAVQDSCFPPADS
jgi:hypothetical protein